jgi:ornithine carbamoyltransferase
MKLLILLLCRPFLQVGILPSGEEVQEKFMPYQINLEVLKQANKSCLVNPCPPFIRGNEVTVEVINSEHFPCKFLYSCAETTTLLIGKDILSKY